GRGGASTLPRATGEHGPGHRTRRGVDPEGTLVIADGFTALYDRHARALYRYCARRLGPDLAEDAVAQTFLIAYERRQRIQDGVDPVPWLFGIATNVVYRH